MKQKSNFWISHNLKSYKVLSVYQDALRAFTFSFALKWWVGQILSTESYKGILENVASRIKNVIIRNEYLKALLPLLDF